jgi:hypothetical protein
MKCHFDTRHDMPAVQLVEWDACDSGAVKRHPDPWKKREP